LLEQRRLSIFVNQTADLAFYNAATQEADARLAGAQRQLEDFRRQYGVVAYPGQLTTLLAERQLLSEALNQANIDLAGAEGRAAELHRQRSVVPAEIREYTDTATGSHFSGLVRSGRNPTLTVVENDIQQNDATRKGLVGRIAEISQQRASLDTQIRTAGVADSERVRLEGSVSTLEETRHVLATHLEEARALADLERRQGDNVRLVQAPTLPAADAPARPAPVMYMALAAAVGLAGGLTVAAASALFPRRTINPLRRRQYGKLSSRTASEPVRANEGPSHV